MEDKLKFIGNIKLGNQVVCSDPCYDDYGEESTINCFIDNVKAGMYNAFYGIVEKELWGKRVSQIMVIHEDYDNVRNGIDLNQFEWFGDCCVDSGTCGIWDYYYYETYHEDGLDDDWYDNHICYLLDKVALFGGESICSASGYGDGCYGVFVKYNDNDEIIAIQILYIGEEED